jgi:D-mannonate dehydratase
MYQTMKTYYEAGFRGPMRPDHVPTVSGDTNDHPWIQRTGNPFRYRVYQRLDGGRGKGTLKSAPRNHFIQV